MRFRIEKLIQLYEQRLKNRERDTFRTEMDGRVIEETKKFIQSLKTLLKD